MTTTNEPPELKKSMTDSTVKPDQLNQVYDVTYPIDEQKCTRTECEYHECYMAEEFTRSNQNDEAKGEKVDDLREDMKPKIHISVHHQR